MGRSSWQQVLVKAPPCAPDRLAVFTAGERPDLWSVASGERSFTELWPEYNHRGNSAGLYSGALYPGLAHIQALSVDRRSSQLAGRARTAHLTPVGRYAACHGDDGLPFDPRLRADAGLGGVRGQARSTEIRAPVEDWEAWTAVAFPEDGDHVFPRRLAPLRVTRGGTYWGPNV